MDGREIPGPPPPHHPADGPVPAQGLLDAGFEPAYDRLSALACDVLAAPSAAVSIIDDLGDRQYFKSHCGFSTALAAARETPLSQSLCRTVRDTGRGLSIRDIREDARYREAAQLGIVAYLGHPIHLPCGMPIGALCVFDERPREWSDDDSARLRTLAGSVDETIRRVAATEDAELARRMAARAARARELFLVGLNHDIRTALNGIVCPAEILADLPLDDDSQELTRSIERSGRELSVLLETLLEETAAATRQDRREWKRGLDDILAEAFAGLRATSSGRAHRLTRAPSSGAARLGEVDAFHFKQVVHDLLGNAMIASPTGASDIEVNVAENSHIHIRVTLDADPHADGDLWATLPDLDFKPVRSLTNLAGGSFEISAQSRQCAVFEARLPLVSGVGSEFGTEAPDATQGGKRCARGDTSALHPGHR